MFEKLKEIENMSTNEIVELQQAMLAYDLNLSSDTMTLEEADCIKSTIEAYYEDAECIYFINQKIINNFTDNFIE